MLTTTQIEEMRDKVKGSSGELILMAQDPAHHHHWIKGVARAEQQQWLEVLDLALMAARIRER